MKQTHSDDRLAIFVERVEALRATGYRNASAANTSSKQTKAASASKQQAKTAASSTQ